jgi:hypothetical protein
MLQTISELRKKRAVTMSSKRSDRQSGKAMECVAHNHYADAYMQSLKKMGNVVLGLQLFIKGRIAEVVVQLV